MEGGRKKKSVCQSQMTGALYKPINRIFSMSFIDELTFFLNCGAISSFVVQ